MTKANSLDISRISASILKNPQQHGRRFVKGVLILNFVDEVLARLPLLKDIFFIVERRGWHGMNPSCHADVKLVEDSSTLVATQLAFPNAIALNIGPADFIDTDSFRPLNLEPVFDCIQIACWSRRKRIELLIDAAARLPHLKFINLGHFEFGGTVEEHRYRDECLARSAQLAPNVTFPLADCSHNEQIPRDKESVNQWINKAKIGILTAESEGINRFKMECLAANRPMLVANDVCVPTKKHIHSLTGTLFDPRPQSLSDAIEATLSRLHEFKCREYIEANTGQRRSIALLKSALRQLCTNRDELYDFDDITWDGRNRSMAWGITAFNMLSEKVSQWSQLYRFEEVSGRQQ